MASGAVDGFLFPYSLYLSHQSLIEVHKVASRVYGEVSLKQDLIATLHIVFEVHSEFWDRVDLQSLPARIHLTDRDSSHSSSRQAILPLA